MRRSPPAGLRDELEAAVLTYVELIGPGGFDKTACVAPFLDRGVSRSTLFRWVDAVLASGRATDRITEVVKEAARDRAIRTPEPSKDAAQEIVAAMPRVLKPDDIISSSAGGLGAIRQLQRCIVNVQKVIDHAQTPDGGVRNAKLMLMASENLRRCLETSIRLHAAMREGAALEAYQDAMIAEIGIESPECAERIHRRILDFIGQWGG